MSDAGDLGARPWTARDGLDAPAPAEAGIRARGKDWRALHYFNAYRVALAGLLVILAAAGAIPRAIGTADAGVFMAVAILYLALALVGGFAARLPRPSFDTHVRVDVFVDIVAITLLMHASGGVTSGLGMLLVISVAGGSVLSQGRIAILFAAMATVAVLTQQILVWRADPATATAYTHAGILGAAFFATALLAHLSAQRIRASEALVAEREVDLANLAELNEHIIHRMQSGILVVDPSGKVRLGNDSARALLGCERDVHGARLAAIEPELSERYRRWRDDRSHSSYRLRSPATQLELIASFAALGRAGQSGVLIFLEDASAVTQRAQELKLASLGRLTASIAHEVRNPLGAISHAGQLLEESPDLSAPDQRLAQIIQDNCRRVNRIIEDVLELSRRTPPVRRKLLAGEWLEEFVAEHDRDGSVRGGKLKFSVEPPDLQLPFDPGQLRQVVSNLTENGLRHGGEGPVVELRAGFNPDAERPYLDVVDSGEGIAAAVVENVFEPFFTTRSEGTGLGLYIARELCEANQASLTLLDHAGGCRFRITFADPRRQGVVSG